MDRRWERPGTLRWPGDTDGDSDSDPDPTDAGFGVGIGIGIECVRVKSVRRANFREASLAPRRAVMSVQIPRLARASAKAVVFSMTSACSRLGLESATMPPPAW